MCEPKRVLRNFNIISNTLSFLEYGNRFRFTLKNNLRTDDQNFIHDITTLEKIIYKSLSNYSKDTKLKYKTSIVDLYEIQESLKTVSRKLLHNLDKTFTVTIRLDEKEKDIDFLMAISVLIKHDILMVCGFKLSEKEDNRKFIVFGDASSGEQCLALMLLGIAGKIKDNSLICIDEPEISLHPEWQSKFIKLLGSIYSDVKGCHFVIATHSPHIISNLSGDNSFILNMDKKVLLTSDVYQKKSADYQLAKLFNTPGKHNEYINRICVNLLCHVSKKGKINKIEREDFDFLVAIKDKLDPNDNSIVLIDVLIEAIAVLGGVNEANCL